MSQPHLEYFPQNYDPISRPQSESPAAMIPQDNRLPAMSFMSSMGTMPNANEYLAPGVMTTASMSTHDMQNMHVMDPNQDHHPITSALNTVSSLPNNGEQAMNEGQLIGLINTDQPSASTVVGGALPPSTLHQQLHPPMPNFAHSLAKPMPLRVEQPVLPQLQIPMTQGLLQTNEEYSQPMIAANGMPQHLLPPPAVPINAEHVNLGDHTRAFQNQLKMEDVSSMADSNEDPSRITPLPAAMPASVMKVLSGSSHQRSRSEKKPIPEGQKDDKYFERRKRNNLAAKKSRDARKAREDEIAIRASFLEKENSILRAQVATLREEAKSLRKLLVEKKNGRL